MYEAKKSGKNAIVLKMGRFDFTVGPVKAGQA